MKFTLLFLTCLAVALGAPPAPKKFAPAGDQNDVAILRQHNENNGETYSFGFEQSDGIKRDETGEVRVLGDSEGIVMRGFYEYLGPDGNTYRVS